MVRWTKNRVYDVIHRSFTGSMIAFTAVGSVWLGYKFVTYMMYTRPVRMDEMRKLKETKLAEQQMDVQQQLQQQKLEAETLRP